MTCVPLGGASVAPTAAATRLRAMLRPSGSPNAASMLQGSLRLAQSRHRLLPAQHQLRPTRWMTQTPPRLTSKSSTPAWPTVSFQTQYRQNLKNCTLRRPTRARYQGASMRDLFVKTTGGEGKQSETIEIRSGNSSGSRSNKSAPPCKLSSYQGRFPAEMGAAGRSLASPHLRPGLGYVQEVCSDRLWPTASLIGTVPESFTERF